MKKNRIPPKGPRFSTQHVNAPGPELLESTEAAKRLGNGSSSPPGKENDPRQRAAGGRKKGAKAMAPAAFATPNRAASTGPLPAAHTASLPSPTLIDATRDMHEARPTLDAKAFAARQADAFGVILAARVRGVSVSVPARSGAAAARTSPSEPGRPVPMLLAELAGAIDVVRELRQADAPLQTALLDPATVAERTSIALPLHDVRGRAMLLANVVAELQRGLPAWAEADVSTALLQTTVSTVMAHQLFTSAQDAVDRLPKKVAKQLDGSGDMTATLTAVRGDQEAIGRYLQSKDVNFSAQEMALKNHIVALLIEHDAPFAADIEQHVGAYLVALMDAPSATAVTNALAECAPVRAMIARGTGYIDAGFARWGEKKFAAQALLPSGQSAAAKVVHMACMQQGEVIGAVDGYTIREYKFGNSGRALVGRSNEGSVVLFFSDQHINASGSYSTEYLRIAERVLRNLEK